MSNNDNGERPCILVTGGCGYIGSHTITCLLERNYDVVVVDNLSNSSKISLDQVAKIVGIDEERQKRIVFHEVDLCDKDALRKVFESSPKFLSCIHFAGLKVWCPAFQGNEMQESFEIVFLMSSLLCNHLVRPLEKVRVSLWGITKTIWLAHSSSWRCWMSLIAIRLYFLRQRRSMGLQTRCQSSSRLQ